MAGREGMERKHLGRGVKGNRGFEQVREDYAYLSSHKLHNSCFSLQAELRSTLKSKLL